MPILGLDPRRPRCQSKVPSVSIQSFCSLSSGAIVTALLSLSFATPQHQGDEERRGSSIPQCSMSQRETVHGPRREMHAVS